MARRKRTEIDVAMVDERELEQRLHHIKRSFQRATDDPAGQEQQRTILEALNRFHQSLERRALPLEEQLAGVEGWLEERGLLEQCLQFVAHLEAAAARWGS